jgi:polysaccharide biosynthesis protein PslH
MQRFFVIPNAVDVAAYPTCDEAQESCTMLFTGLMSYYANAHGVAWLLEEIFPRIKAAVPQARLIVAGARPSRRLKARSSEHVTVTGYVPDIRPYYARAEVFVAPLRIGGGTRVKILEAMAMRRAVVATTLACEGLDVRHEDTVLLADRPQSFADAVIRLFNDKTVRDGFADRGRALVQARYDWPAIGARMDAALLSVVRPRKAGAA